MSHFEIVRTDAGWHTRYRAANGRIVWWTENYKRRAGALAAIAVLVKASFDAVKSEIRDLDERGRS